MAHNSREMLRGGLPHHTTSDASYIIGEPAGVAQNGFAESGWKHPEEQSAALLLEILTDHAELPSAYRPNFLEQIGVYLVSHLSENHPSLVHFDQSHADFS